MSTKEFTVLALFNSRALFEILDGADGPTRGDHVLGEEELLSKMSTHDELLFCVLDAQEKDTLNFYPEVVELQFPHPTSAPLTFIPPVKGIGELSKRKAEIKEHLEATHWGRELPHSVLLIILEDRDLSMTVNNLRANRRN